MADIPEVVSSDPNEMLSLGRRHLAVKDYSSAVTCLGKACELLAQQHGQHADECGEAYFWYGKSLLGLAREESGVLGDGIPGGDENQEDEEDEEAVDEDNNDEAEKEGANTEDKNEDIADKEVKADEVKEDKKEESKEEEPMVVDNENKSESKVDDVGPSSSAGPSSSKAGPSSGDDENIEAEEDEIENLQLAWEVFELARDVFIKRGDNGKKELADVYLHLGEVSLESEMYDKAVTDMGKSLELFKELYKDDDRRIAETHYQIGLAHSLSNGFDDAIQNFKSAAEILERRIENLKKPNAATEDEDVKSNISNDPFYSIEGEVKEISELLPEIKEKIQDMIDYKAEAIKSVRESLGLNKTNGESKQNGNHSTEEKKASDISHLVKRKRKAEDEVKIEECSEAKRPAN